MRDSSTRSDPLRVLIVGGGIAATEILLALNDLARDTVAVELLAPNRELVYMPLAVAEPFGLGPARRFDLQEIASKHAARLHVGSVANVDASRRRITTANGDELGYETLALAVGARPREAVPGAFTLLGEHGFAAYSDQLDRLQSGRPERVAFVVPGAVTWALPVYELALLTQVWLAARGQEKVRLDLVTPEAHPLGVFGRRASSAVAALFAERGIGLLTGRYAVAFEAGELFVAGEQPLPFDKVIALPRLEGPAIGGLPSAPGGFIPVDRHGAVRGVPDVYAAGDATTFPVKQGGIATQQADVVAAAIAARAGVDIDPEPFDPVLRGLLLTGTIPLYLKAELRGGRGETSEAEVEPIWWPPTKIAGDYLSGYLARLAALQPPQSDAVWLRLETDDLESYLQPREGSARR
jgi:sulfide:quinone oxidoreductase